MQYTDFRNSIQQELLSNPAGLTWVELRDRLSLPYNSPCQTWVLQLEKEIGLHRKDRIHNAYIWKLNLTKE